MTDAAPGVRGSTTTARGLLLTVLGEYVLPAQPAGAWTSTIVRVLGALDVEEKTARQVLARTAERGLISTQRTGRRARWLLTDEGRRLLTDGTARIYSFHGAADHWDGQWLIILASAPEGNRRARHLLTSRFGWAGLGKLAAGTWISPHPDRVGEVQAVLSEAGLGSGARIFVSRSVDGSSAESLAAAAWDLSDISAYYTWFIGQFTAPPSDDPIAVLADQVRLVHFWRHSLLLDPGLPRALLPAGWPGLAAAEVFHQRHDRDDAVARVTWARLERD